MNNSGLLDGIDKTFDCSENLRMAMKKYFLNHSHENWIFLSQIYNEKCPNGKNCLKCQLLRNIASHILAKE